MDNELKIAPMPENEKEYCGWIGAASKHPVCTITIYSDCSVSIEQEVALTGQALSALSASVAASYTLNNTLPREYNGGTE